VLQGLVLLYQLNKMGHNYSAKGYDKENMARAIGISLDISFKQSVEICNFIRNKNITYVKGVLNKVISQEMAIPFRRFNMNMGHKKNMAAGRYPKKASIAFLSLINHVEANAQFKGLNTANLVITQIIANKPSKVMHFGRKRSREAKKTNVEIVVREKTTAKKDERIKKGEKIIEQAKEIKQKITKKETITKKVNKA